MGGKEREENREEDEKGREHEEREEKQKQKQQKHTAHFVEKRKNDDRFTMSMRIHPHNGKEHGVRSCVRLAQPQQREKDETPIVAFCVACARQKKKNQRGSGGKKGGRGKRKRKREGRILEIPKEREKYKGTGTLRGITEN